MQAIVMTEPGGPEVLVLRETPDPMPGPGEIVVHSTAIPVLYPEIPLRTGAFPMAGDLPAVFGFEAAGVVAEIGTGVDAGLLGARVVVTTLSGGSYAEKVCVPAESATRIPDGLSDDDAAAALMGGSVTLALLDRAALTGSETVLVQAASAGIGGYLTQLAREAGAARIIATAGGAKTDRAKALGADDVLDHNDPDWTRRLPEILGDTTIDVVFDSIGGETSAALLDAMTPMRGRMLGYGLLSGAPAQVTAAELMARGLTYTGCAGPAWLARVASLRAAALDRAAAGSLRPLIDRILPLRDAAAAHRLMQDRATVGTVILRPDSVAP